MFFAAIAAALISANVTAAPVLSDNTLTIENVVVSGALTNPISMVFLDADDILVAEKNSGKIKRVTGGTVQASTVLDLAVANTSEEGLLTILADPSFPAENYLYLYYTHPANDTDGGSADFQYIMRYTWDGSNLVSPVQLRTLPATPGPNHNGGVMKFGPPNALPADQKLFIVIGDLNRNNQLENWSSGNAPDDQACILRINRDGSTPTDGPFYNATGANASLQRVYAYGIRNSFGLEFDPQTNSLWDTENGPGPSPPAYDEVNLVEPAFNSGWEYIMGPTSRNALRGSPGLVQFDGLGTYSDPEFSWANAVAPAAIHFFRGTGLGPAYQFDCFVGDNNNGNLYKFELNPTRTGFVLTGDLADLVYDSSSDSISQILFGESFGVITDLKTGPDSDLYVLSHTNNQIYRIHAPVTGVSEWALFD
jgi:glucose/arabinose dehydrogenase